MSIIVGAGVLVTLAGVGMLIFCAWKARRLRQSDPNEADAKAELQRLIALNMGGVFTGFLGLGIVAVGLFLQ